MVVAAHPLAVDAGYAVLRKGGTAVDAAIAVQLVLNLVEPQSSGIGGGAFMLVHDANRKRLIAYDGRETAPAAAKPDRFLDRDGKPLEFFDAVVGGRSVGVPGTVALLATVHRRHGKLPWSSLFAPAIRLAQDGFPVSPRLHAALAAERHLVQPRARSYFYDAEGRPRADGSRLANPAFAATLRALAAKGAPAFYTGDIARDVVDTTDSSPTNPGDLTLADLARYEVKVREAVCGSYRRYRICGMPLPSSGGLTVLEMLGMLERYDLRAMGPASFWSVHFISEAGRLAYADRGVYMADPDFYAAPAVAARSRLSRSALAADSARRELEARGTRYAAGPGGREGVRIRRASGTRVSIDVAYFDCRFLWQCGGDDDYDREFIRQPLDDRGRLSAQQRAHRFFACADREREAGRQSGRGWQAPALVDGADDRV